MEWLATLVTPVYIYKNQAYLIQNQEVLFKYAKKKSFFETYGAPDTFHAPDLNLSGTKVIHDIVFGLEICYDHNQLVLTDDLRRGGGCAASGRPFPTMLPKIHIVVSDCVEQKKSPVADSGFFIHSSSRVEYSTVSYNYRGDERKEMEGALAHVLTCFFWGDQVDFYMIVI